MDWRPMSEVADMNRVYARNADGEEAWTWLEFGEWVRECWRETDDRQEYRSEEWWTPVEYARDL